MHKPLKLTCRMRNRLCMMSIPATRSFSAISLNWTVRPLSEYLLELSLLAVRENEILLPSTTSYSFLP